MTPNPRHPSGTAQGGRFAPVSHPEAEIRLEDLDRLADQTPAGANSRSGTGAAQRPCPRCEDGITAALSICEHCDGTGQVSDVPLAG